MATRIKFNVFNLLFRLFSFLADKTGGWQLFVKPKLILGALILGISVSSCNSKGKNEVNRPEKQDNETLQVTYYEPTSLSFDTIVSKSVKDRKNYDIVSCYAGGYTDDPDVLKEIYDLVEKMPAFPGGETNLYDFIRKHLVYPEGAIGAGTQGSVVCRFTIVEDGSISDIEILKSLDRYTDEEAVRIIKLMPKWIPGQQSGQAIKVGYILPITFKLK
ncbi:MAG: energy transducer TonB [Dysgonamonadaceae bacterium]|nr:energy transducer TonB [Dysgonamonadaceae bacterium]